MASRRLDFRLCVAVAATCLCVGAVRAPLSAQGLAQASALEGTWDLTWQTRHGPQRSGFIVMRREGASLVGEIHGQGAITARGSLSGATFNLTGSRMLVPYRLDGRLVAGRIEGSLPVLSIERRFIGLRRP